MEAVAREFAIGLGAVGLVYASLVVLHVVVPAVRVKGYACDSDGEALVYRLNGLRVLAVAVALFAAGAQARLWDADIFYRHYGACAAAGCLYGIAVSTFLFLRGRAMERRTKRSEAVFARAVTVDRPTAVRSPTAAEV
jgi:hypothetical protein